MNLQNGITETAIGKILFGCQLQTTTVPNFDDISVQESLSIANLSFGKKSLTFQLNPPAIIKAKMNGAFSQNIGKVFSQTQAKVGNITFIYAEKSLKLLLFSGLSL